MIKSTRFVLHLQIGSGFLRLAVTEPRLPLHWWQRAGLCKRLVTRGAAVEFGLWGRRLNLFHGQLPLGLLAIFASLCQVVFNVFQAPLDQDVVKLHEGSSYRNSKLYGVSDPQMMWFFSGYALSIHPYTVGSLTEKAAMYSVPAVKCNIHRQRISKGYRIINRFIASRITHTRNFPWCIQCIHKHK